MNITVVHTSKWCLELDAIRSANIVTLRLLRSPDKILLQCWVSEVLLLQKWKCVWQLHENIGHDTGQADSSHLSWCGRFSSLCGQRDQMCWSSMTVWTTVMWESPAASWT